MSASQGYATRFPVYQIDFQAVASGKMIASTKRKVRWRFGFPNQQALDAGRSGVDCRGEEHDIAIIWSITSGKRQVYMDGTEIHFSTSRASTFQYSWSAKGNHVIKVLAHAAPMLNATPGWRQYDCYIDGQSFFNMPKAYEIGIRAPSRSPAPTTSNSYGYQSSPSRFTGEVASPMNHHEEENDLQRAINASLQESRQYLANKPYSDSRGAPAPPPAAPVADLMDMGGPPPGAQVPAIMDAPSVASSYNAMPPSYGAAPPPPAQYATQPPPAHAYQQSPGYASQPSYQSPPPAAPGALVVSHIPSQPYAVPPPTPTYAAGPPAPSYASPQPSYASLPPAAPGGYGAPPPAPAGYGAPPPAPAGYGAPPSASVYGAPPPQAGVPTGNFFAPPPVDAFAPGASAVRDPYGLAQPVVHDPFAPRPPPPPTRQDVTNSILNAYGSPTQQPQQQGQPPYPGQPGQPMPPQNGQQHEAAGPALTMNGYAPNEPEKPLSEMEKALKKLVNVDRIDEPAEKEYKLTMMNKTEEKKGKNGKSKGLAPVATGLVGSNATLAHISSVKVDTPKTGEGIMKPPPQLFHPDAVSAGALVIHGQAPPLQRGFGIGYGQPPPNYNQQQW